MDSEDKKTPPSNGDDSNVGIIIGIVIFLLLAIFLIIVIIAWFLSDSPTNTGTNNQVPTETGAFLSACTNLPCNEGMVCDGTSFVCKFDVGTVCSDFSDCVTGLICSGVCATGPTGNLDQLCPCNSGYLCTPQIGNKTVCKGAGGTECKGNENCASGLCQDNGICATGAPNAYPCTMDFQCGSQNCSTGFCQETGIVSGTLGAACAGSCVGYTGAVCNSTPKEPLTCQCSGESNQPGTCVAATQGILSGCSPVRACATDLFCFDLTAQECDGSETGCICLFPYTDVNTVATGGVCINGMSTISGLTGCFNGTGLGCDNGGLCSTSNCGGSSVLAVYQFSKSGTTDMRTVYMGATNTAILAGTSGPSGSTGNIQPYKMFASSSGSTDTIYLVDSLQGFVSLQYDPISMSVVTSWTQLIPHTASVTSGNTTTTKQLIDVGYNGTNFIVAFNETVVVTGTGGSTTQNDTVYIGSTPTNLSPFNVQTGTGLGGLNGTQYTTSNVALSIDYIDISPPNDYPSPGGNGGDVLISFNGTIYIKQSTETKYSIGVIQGGPMNGQQMTGLTGPARFYFDNTENPQGTGPPICPEDGTGPQDNPIRCPSYYNIALVGPFTGFGGGKYDQVLQFSGNVAGIADPIDRFEEHVNVQYRVFDYSIYSPNPAGMPDAAVIMLTNAYLNNSLIDNMVVLSFGGNTTPVPYRISNKSRSVATLNAFYVLSIGSCI